MRLPATRQLRHNHLEVLFNLATRQYRMQDKLCIVGRAIAVVGGQKVGDNYFGNDAAEDFRDLPLAVVGEVAVPGSIGIEAQFTTG